MEPVKIAKQMMDFQKAAFDNSYSAVGMVREPGGKDAEHEPGAGRVASGRGKKGY